MTDSNHSGTITTYSDTVIHRRRSRSQSPKLTEQNITTAKGVDGSALFSWSKDILLHATVAKDVQSFSTMLLVVWTTAPWFCPAGRFA